VATVLIARAATAKELFLENISDVTNAVVKEESMKVLEPIKK